MPSHVRVCAVVVAHNGAQYLPETLTALAGQTRPPDLCVGVDAGSTDNSAALLQQGLSAGSPVVTAPPKTGFGAAVRAGLAELDALAEPATDPSDGIVDWLWLLHDDSAPAPQALHELLLAVERAPSVTIAGAKQVEWENERLLVDVGVSISRWAERVTLIDADELDQGQYDARSDIFAVNSAGMLVRRDVWEALGGFDPALPGTGDDVDLCWRNRLAGHRVVVVPAAKVRHAGSRPNTAASARAFRRAEIFLRLKHAPLWQLPFLMVGAVLGGFGRLFLGMLAKDPGYALASLTASIGGVLRPVDLFRSRRAAAATRTRPRSAVNALITGMREVREHRRSLFEAEPAAASADASGLATPAAAADSAGLLGASLDAGAFEPSGDSNDDFSSLAAPSRAWVGAGAVAAVLLLLAASLIALHRFIGAPALAGGALLPVSGSLGEIWSNASGWWIELGSGYPGHGDPFDYVLWLLGTAGLGHTNAAVVALMLTAMPLAGLSAWFAAGALTRHRGLRFWAAVFWGAAPALQAALGEGRLGALIAHILLPLFVLAMLRAVGGGRPAKLPAETERSRAGAPRGLAPRTDGVPSWAAAAAAGLLLAVLTAAAPTLFVLAAVAVLLLSLRLRRRARTLWWSLLPAAAMLLPVVLSTLNRPRALAADPGVPLAFDPAALWQQLLGFPTAFDVTGSLPLAGFLPAGPWPLVLALIIGAPVVALSAAALFLGARAAPARLAWILSILALLVSWFSAFVATGAAPDALVTPFPAPLVSAAVFLQLCAALLACDALLTRPRTPARPGRTGSPGRTRRSGRPTAVLLGVLLALGPAASLALWSVPLATGTASGGGTNGVHGAASLVAPAAERTLPATAADKGSSAERTRTLLLRTDANDDVTAALMGNGGTTLDGLSAIYAARAITGPVNAEQLAADDDAAADLRRAVAVITAGTGVDPRGELSRLGVGYVVLQQSDTSAELLAGRMDSVPGLAPVGQTGSGWLWRVVGQLDEQGTEVLSEQTGRVRILAADGAVETVVPSERTSVRTSIPAGGEGRQLVLAERANPGWQARLNGAELPATTDGWAQAFELPAEGGELELGYTTVWEPWTGALQVLIVALTVLLALPTRSRTGPVRLPGRQGPRRSEPDNALPDGETAGSSAAAREPATAAGGTGAPSPASDDGPAPGRTRPKQNDRVSASGVSGATEGMR
ncbi:glycosyltransferase family 2 protein [Arthrobacter sp. zg-Y1219]|uniref:glycosyltransferase family 2 protein n=1 Tax=Arthrobacter sp. zg-Y1219 TaxID=3049067 RepID=UPI0024C42308|nr:glycosyltransferase family 2 protein [Arthrobacter sp. zg-Y1219]MDK1360128.1 glycosyltransferase family 2 protein [Arthrobacter sp. zg-Y1219]